VRRTSKFLRTNVEGNILNHVKEVINKKGKITRRYFLFSPIASYYFKKFKMICGV
jgi:hypothetical protein